MTSAPTAANGRPGVIISRVRPSSGPRSGRPTPSRARARWWSRRRRCDGGRASGLVDGSRRRRRHGVGLAVQRVVGEIVHGHGPERVEADAERHLDHLVAAAQPLQQGRREVQACGGSGGRPRVAGIHGLVALRVGERRSDVRRERHLSHAVEGHSYGAWPRLSGARPLDVWPHQQAAVVQAPLDGDRELAGGHRLAVAQPPGRPCERLPAAVRLGLEQQHLHRSAAAAPRPDPHRQHAGVVQHHQVVLAQLVQQVAEVPVPDRARGPVVHQEPRAVAGLGGRLRDQRRWKVVVEVVGAHRIS